FSCNFFAPQTIFTFQGSLPEFRWHDQSEFREIIYQLLLYVYIIEFSDPKKYQPFYSFAIFLFF
ncbi:MAG: hypothetical protein KH611_12470, partial [Clostridium sp.]|nr:hypothetical protein [Clostridium sp.]